MQQIVNNKRDPVSVRTILHLSSTGGPGGAEMLVSRLAGRLDRSRFRSVACLPRPGWLKDQFDLQGIDTHVLKMSRIFDLTWILHACRLARQEGVSLIHAHEFDAITLGSLVAKLVRVPCVATIHGKNYYWERRRRRLAVQVVSHFVTMVVVSEDLKRFITRNVGVPAERIKVIYNGQETSQPVRSEEKERLRTELDLQENKQVVGLVGSLYPVKGHQYLLAAVPQILKIHPHTTFLIAGRGELELPLKEEVKRCGLEKQVCFLGFREDVSTLLSLLDAFVLPSLSEGLSMALLEAMAAGKAVVATDVGGNPEVVVDGETGFLVPPRDADALAAKICLLLEDNLQSRRLGENGRARVRQCFSFQAMVNKYQDLYDNCLQR